jgi:sarcosine oxidase subunit beta
MKKVCVIGGGIIGLTTAFVLDKRQESHDEHYDITLIEKENHVGTKSTTAAGCGLRAVYDHPTNIELAKKGIQFWSNAENIFNGDVGLRKNGYRFLTKKEEHGSQFKNLSSKQHSYGMSCNVQEPPQDTRGIAGLKTSNYDYGLYSPAAAIANPDKMASMLYGALQDSSSVDVELNSQVNDVANTDEGVSLDANGFSRRYDYVINAAGAWSQNIADMVDFKLPVRNSRRRLSVLDMKIDPGAPLTVDIDTGIYILPSESGDAMVGGHILDTADNISTDNPEAFSTEQDPKWNSKLSETAKGMSEEIASSNVLESWSGLYNITPSRIPIVDQDKGVIHATGFSGHGIMQAPGAAMMIARMLFNQDTGLGVPTPLRANRNTRSSDVQF